MEGDSDERVGVRELTIRRTVTVVVRTYLNESFSDRCSKHCIFTHDVLSRPPARLVSVFRASPIGTRRLRAVGVVNCGVVTGYTIPLSPPVL